jgi:RNA polymerase sigma-70 factor (ECF subfamily)
LRSGPGELDLSPSSGPGNLSQEFVTAIAGSQRPLYAYIRSLVGPWAEAEDILQEVNVVLCRKAAEFDGRGRFLTWACSVAYHQVLAYLKKRQRDRHTYFDETVLADLAEPLARQVEAIDSRLDVLRHCLSQLSAEQRRMIATRYAPGGSVQKIVEQTGRPAGSVRVTLHRLRTLLLACMERNSAVDGR